MGLDTVSDPYPSTPPRPPSYASITPQRSRDQDECFNCRERGHWSSNCPNKAPKKSPSSTPGSSSNSSSDFPVVRCPCDSGICPVRTSYTDKNPHRKFYACPADQSKGKCGFFKWCDEIKGVPACACGAGTCSLNRASTGPNEGKWYFACRIKKNHGACDFFQWADNELNSLLNKNRHGERKGYDSPQPNSNDRNIPLQNEEVNSNYPLNVLLSNQGEVLNQDLIMLDADSLNPIVGNGVQIFQSKPITETESHHSLRELRSNSSDAGITITKVIDAEDEEMSCLEGSSQTQTPRQDVQLFGGFRLEALALKYPSSLKQDNDALSKSVFNKLAQSLFDILEDMGPHDPDQMLKVAEAIFTSLQKLSIECGPFVQAVKDYIHNISKLNSMHNRLSSQELISICENEKARLNNSSQLHSEALAAYRASETQCRSLEEEILYTKGVLIKLEEQLLCCKAETSRLKNRSDEANKEVLELEKSVQDVAFDLAETLALERQREFASNAARDAFEAAKVWVRL